MKKHIVSVVYLGVLSMVLSACSTISPTKVSADGTTDKPVWPRWDSVTFDNHRGTFPDLSSLKEVKAGMTKDQIYHLLGRPHYDEIWRPREWNYLFHFHTPNVGTDGVTTCQFKILFDKDKLTRSFYYNPIDPIDAACQDLVNPVLSTPAPMPVVVLESAQPISVPIVKETINLGADALFNFDKWQLSEMKPEGRTQLDELAEKLKQWESRGDSRVVITGHTDRLGDDMYNLSLSQLRAQTVYSYLVSRGVSAKTMIANGAGETQQIKACSDSLGRAKLIECLQPNRRVQVDVSVYAYTQNGLQHIDMNKDYQNFNQAQ